MDNQNHSKEYLKKHQFNIGLQERESFEEQEKKYQAKKKTIGLTPQAQINLPKPPSEDKLLAFMSSLSPKQLEAFSEISGYQQKLIDRIDFMNEKLTNENKRLIESLNPMLNENLKLKQINNQLQDEVSKLKHRNAVFVDSIINSPKSKDLPGLLKNLQEHPEIIDRMLM